MTYLLDTNVLSEPLKSVPDVGVMKQIERHQGKIATAAPVWHELQYGCRRLVPSRKRKLIERYLQEIVLPNIPILAYEETAAEWHAQHRAVLSKAGKTPAFVDGQIAAVAAVNGLVLVTRNIADFAAFEDLVAECWHSDECTDSG